LDRVIAKIKKAADSPRPSFRFAYPSGQSNAAPTIIFRINNHGEPCEIEFVCVG